MQDIFPGADEHSNIQTGLEMSVWMALLQTGNLAQFLQELESFCEPLQWLGQRTVVLVLAGNHTIAQLHRELCEMDLQWVHPASGSQRCQQFDVSGYALWH